MKIFFTPEALTEMTVEQQVQLVALTGDHVEQIDVTAGTFDLPNGYLTVKVVYTDGQTIYGGMSRDGVLST